MQATRKKANETKTMNLKTALIVTGDLQENCYLLWDSEQKQAVVFDAGAEPELIERELKKRHLTIAAFLQTHCHGDHIGAVTALKTHYPKAPLYVPEAEQKWMQRPTLNLSYFLGVSITGPEPENLVRDGDEIIRAGLIVKAIHVPGHSPGSTAYFVDAGAHRSGHLFCGDILFAGSIGRTDLPGGDGEDVLIANIRAKLFTLPGNTIVHPGHGPETTIGEEKATNPFCGTT
jgi:glyoxylase-like metal-dependent hydrolase (beta-lactamase superfamily II)